MQQDATHFRCIEKGDLESVTQALCNGFNVNTTAGTIQQTALHTAAEKGNGATIQVLLDHGADINTCDKQNQTALFCAVEMGRKGAVKVLLANGADPDLAANCLSIKDHTPLDLSISTIFDSDDRKITKMLVLYGAYFKNTDYQLISVLKARCFKDQPLAVAVVLGDSPDPKIDWENYLITDKQLKHIIIAAAAKGREKNLSFFLSLCKSRPNLFEKTVHKVFTIAALRTREDSIDLLLPIMQDDDKIVHKTFTVIQNLLKYATLSFSTRISYQKTESKILAARIHQNLPDSYFSKLPRDIKTMVMGYYAKFS